MDQILFNCYLKHLKTKRAPFSKALLQVPVMGIVLFIILLLFVGLGIIFCILGKYQISFICTGIGYIVCAIFGYYVDQYTISRGDVLLERHWAHCSDLKQWLKTKRISDSTHIQEVKDRTEKKIDELIAERDANFSRADKWLEMLGIPVVIAIITNTIESADSSCEKLPFLILVLFVFFIIHLFVRAVLFISSLSKKRTIKQMTCFLEDLQGVLDLDQFNDD